MLGGCEARRLSEGHSHLMLLKSRAGPFWSWCLSPFPGGQSTGHSGLPAVAGAPAWVPSPSCLCGRLPGCLSWGRSCPGPPCQASDGPLVQGAQLPAPLSPGIHSLCRSCPPARCGSWGCHSRRPATSLCTCTPASSSCLPWGPGRRSSAWSAGSLASSSAL